MLAIYTFLYYEPNLSIFFHYGISAQKFSLQICLPRLARLYYMMTCLHCGTADCQPVSVDVKRCSRGQYANMYQIKKNKLKQYFYFDGCISLYKKPACCSVKISGVDGYLTASIQKIPGSIYYIYNTFFQILICRLLKNCQVLGTLVYCILQCSKTRV